MSEGDFPRGASTRLQLALIFVSGATNQDEAMRGVLQLLRRKYPAVESAVATVVQACGMICRLLPITCQQHLSTAPAHGHAWFCTSVRSHAGAWRDWQSAQQANGDGSPVWARMQAHGVIGNQPGGPVEVEQTPAVSLTLASFASTAVSTFSATGELMPDAGRPASCSHPCRCRCQAAPFSNYTLQIALTRYLKSAMPPHADKASEWKCHVIAYVD